MDLNLFLSNFCDCFDDMDLSCLNEQTRFRELDEWSSLVALTVMAMICDEYDVEITADEMRDAQTIQDLINIVNSHL